MADSGSPEGGTQIQDGAAPNDRIELLAPLPLQAPSGEPAVPRSSRGLLAVAPDAPRIVYVAKAGALIPGSEAYFPYVFDLRTKANVALVRRTSGPNGDSFTMPLLSSFGLSDRAFSADGERLAFVASNLVSFADLSGDLAARSRRLPGPLAAVGPVLDLTQVAPFRNATVPSASHVRLASNGKLALLRNEPCSTGYPYDYGMVVPVLDKPTTNATIAASELIESPCASQPVHFGNAAGTTLFATASGALVTLTPGGLTTTLAQGAYSHVFAGHGLVSPEYALLQTNATSFVRPLGVANASRDVILGPLVEQGLYLRAHDPMATFAKDGKIWQRDLNLVTPAQVVAPSVEARVWTSPSRDVAFQQGGAVFRSVAAGGAKIYESSAGPIRDGMFIDDEVLALVEGGTNPSGSALEGASLVLLDVVRGAVLFRVGPSDLGRIALRQALPQPTRYMQALAISLQATGKPHVYLVRTALEGTLVVHADAEQRVARLIPSAEFAAGARALMTESGVDARVLTVPRSNAFLKLANDGKVYLQPLP